MVWGSMEIVLRRFKGRFEMDEIWFRDRLRMVTGLASMKRGEHHQF